MSDFSTSEIVALRIMVQRTLALLASMQPDPNGFVRNQLRQALNDADGYKITGADDSEAIREHAKNILENLFHGVLQPEPPRQ